MRVLVLAALLSGCVHNGATTGTETPPGSCPRPWIHDFRVPPQWTSLDQSTLDRATSRCLRRGLCLQWLNIYEDNRYRAYCAIRRTGVDDDDKLVLPGWIP